MYVCMYVCVCMYVYICMYVCLFFVCLFFVCLLTDPYKHCVEGRTGIHLAVLVGKGNDTDFRNVLLAFKNNMCV